jgi:hypothetical protein
LEIHGCEIYESRPSCCRNYPLARVIEDEGRGGKRSTKYYLQRRATYCQGMGRGPEGPSRPTVRKTGWGLMKGPTTSSCRSPLPLTHSLLASGRTRKCRR